ncbi:hypothetical protein ACIA8K_39620 [Catenuloplanes sp. NPDC051500]
MTTSYSPVSSGPDHSAPSSSRIDGIGTRYRRPILSSGTGNSPDFASW